MAGLHICTIYTSFQFSIKEYMDKQQINLALMAVVAKIWVAVT